MCTTRQATPPFSPATASKGGHFTLRYNGLQGIAEAISANTFRLGSQQFGKALTGYRHTEMRTLV